MPITLAYPKFNELFATQPRGGSLIEGRMNRKGAVNMHISAYTAYHCISNVRVHSYSDPLIPNFPLKSVEYEIFARTFLPLEILGEIKRYDTLAFWFTTFQEVLRHLALATQYTQSPVWKYIQDVYQSIRQDVIDAIDTMLHNIISLGDFTLEHFRYYVKEHGDSASPFGCKWSDILADERALVYVHDLTNKAIRDFVDSWKKSVDGKDRYLKPEYSYPAVRARPPQYTVLSSNAYEIFLRAFKWRDRKAGGVAVISQLGYPYYQNGKKAAVEAPVRDLIKRKLGCTVSELTHDGAQTYMALLDGKWNVYDIKTAEKQVGILFRDLGFSMDLGHPQFEATNSGEMYSGIAITSLLNELFIMILLMALTDKTGIKITRICLFADNFAVDAKLEDSVHAELKPDFCGFLVTAKKFGPPSLVTDNPTHRINFNLGVGRQVQSQQFQYGGRVLQAVVQNAIAYPDSAIRYLEFINQNAARLDPRKKDLWLHHYIGEMILTNDEVREKFIDVFAREKAYIDSRFPLQWRDPDYTSNLRVA